MYNLVIQAMERGLVPDFAIRMGIRKLCRDRLRSISQKDEMLLNEKVLEYVEELKKSPLAPEAHKANEQHYELPSEFFHLVLGKNKKYSSAYYSDPDSTLDKAEDVALQETIHRVEIKDGMSILELGCGWGSLTLAMARKFPKSKIVALSNSQPQRLYIEERCQIEGLQNVQILTRNIENVENLAEEFGLFDRVVSVEMFEHLRNYELLLHRISSWLKPEGKLFVHIFTHKTSPYLFEVEGEDNWMGKYFFTGGQMPSQSLFSYFQKDLKLTKQWLWNGIHYSKTSEDWLKNLDQKKPEVMEIFKKTYGEKDAGRWFHRWRIFFLSCAELFGFDKGEEWGVSHYLFVKKSN